MNEAQFSVYITRGILQFAAARYGIEADQLCAAIGLDPTVLNTPDQRISGTLHSAVWREAVARTGDENLGLHLGEVFNLATFGIVGYVLVNCQTFEEVLSKLSRYTQIFSQGAHIHFAVIDGWVHCDCDVVHDLKNYLLEEPRQAIESTFASVLTATKTLTGQTLRPYAVWFQFPQPADLSEHERIFNAPLHFSMPTNRLVLEAQCLTWPVLSANVNLRSIFESHADAMLQEMNQEHPYRRQVAQAIAHQLKGELPAVDAIAHDLALSVRQLQRELAAEGTSFQTLLNETRKELALRHLKNPQAAIHDVAFLLGFSDPTAFHRAFKRWTGQTPNQYRSQAEATELR